MGSFPFPNGGVAGCAFSFSGERKQAVKVWAAAASAKGEITPIEISKSILDGEDLQTAAVKGSHRAFLQGDPGGCNLIVMAGQIRAIRLHIEEMAIYLMQGPTNWSVLIWMDKGLASRSFRVWRALQELGVPLEFVRDDDGSVCPLRDQGGCGYVRPITKYEGPIIISLYPT